MTSVRTEAVTAARDTIPFLIITTIWVVIMLVLYGLFLATKPDIDYAGWVHASVFLPGLIGYLGHVLHQSFTGLTD